MRETFSPEQFREPPALRDAEELFDRLDIEAEACQLIAEHEALSTAEVPEQEWANNARSAIFEALTASGHLSRIELEGDFEAVNRQILDRLIKGYLSCSDPHERDRRFAELCNELVIQKTLRLVVLGELDESTAIAEMSDYPIGLDDKRARGLGYRSYNRKGMVRSTQLCRNADGSYTRIIEQMSRSNGTPETALAFLHDANIFTSEHIQPDLAVLNKPAIYKSAYNYADGVVALQRRLDAFAGPDIQYGEIRGANALHVPYEEVRAESIRRETEIEFYIERLGTFEKRLAQAEAAGHITSEQRRGQYGEELHQILRSICLLAPEYAEDCFGEQAAAYYYEASDFIAMGDYARADMLLQRASSVEQSIMICGELIGPEKAKELGLTPDDALALTAEAKASWKKTKGVCRIKNCPSPKPTELGPCHICMKSCQPLFDARKNPATEYTKLATKNELAEPEQTDTLAKSAGKFALVA